MKHSILLFVAFAAIIELHAQSISILRASSVYRKDAQFGMILEDSLEHIHTSGHSSIARPYQTSHSFYPDNGAFEDDTAYRYRVPGQPATEKFYRKYNVAGLTTVHVRQELTGNFPHIFETAYSYNSTMLVDTITHSVSGGMLQAKKTPSTRDIFTYNVNTVLEAKNQEWNPGTSSWNNNTIDSFIAAGGAGSDSMLVRYKWTNGAYTETIRHKYTRDGNNRAVKDSMFSGGICNAIRSLTYDNSGRLLQDNFLWWDATVSSFQQGPTLDYNYDAQSKLVSIYYGNGIWGTHVDSFTYNANNQVVSFITYDEDYEPATNMYAQFFYYHDPVHVSQVTTKDNLEIYPVPATSSLNVNVSFNNPRPFSLYIFDINGKLISHWTEPAQRTYTKQIPVVHMPAGLYSLYIAAGDESRNRQFSVLK